MLNRLVRKRSTLVTMAFVVSLGLHQSLQPACAESTGHGEESGEANKQNLVGLFVGLTGESRRENGLALGAEYTRRLTESFGIGAIVERTAGDLDFWLAAVSFGWYKNRWKLYAAPGIEDVDGESGINELLRIGGLYAFEAGRWEIAPQVNYDIVAGENAVIVGVAFGWGF